MVKNMAYLAGTNTTNYAKEDTEQKFIIIVEFDPDWAFPDCNSSLNSPMATECCTKLEVA